MITKLCRNFFFFFLLYGVDYDEKHLVSKENFFYDPRVIIIFDFWDFFFLISCAAPITYVGDMFHLRFITTQLCQNL